MSSSSSKPPQRQTLPVPTRPAKQRVSTDPPSTLDYADSKRKAERESKRPEPRTGDPPTTKRPALAPQATDTGMGPPTVRARNYTLSEPTFEQFDEDDLDLPGPDTTQNVDFEAAAEQTMPGTTSPAPPSQRDPIFHLKERYALGDFTGALMLAESILEGDPDNSIAQGYATNAKQVLVHMYSARLGSTNSRPSIVMPPRSSVRLQSRSQSGLRVVADRRRLDDRRHRRYVRHADARSSSHLVRSVAAKGDRHRSAIAPKIFAVVPARDEQANLAHVIATMPTNVCAIVIVDDGSIDNTAQIANSVGDPRVTVLSRSPAQQRRRCDRHWLSSRARSRCRCRVRARG